MKTIQLNTISNGLQPDKKLARKVRLDSERIVFYKNYLNMIFKT